MVDNNLSSSFTEYLGIAEVLSDVITELNETYERVAEEVKFTWEKIKLIKN
jgi:hypothetical protein